MDLAALPQCPDSIDAHKWRILIASLALIAETLANTDTILTTASLKMWSGYVQHAITGDTNWARGEASTKSDQTRFRYESKASRWEREAGLDSLDATERQTPMAGRGQPGLRCKLCGHWKNSGSPCECPTPDFEQSAFERPTVRNHHPTVKALDLMRWLVRMVCRQGGTVLDCFLGSGTTGCAAVVEGMNFIGIEQSTEYMAIAKARIAYWQRNPAPYVLAPELARQVRADQIVPVTPKRSKPVDPQQPGLF